MQIGSLSIGAGQPVFIIAEAGVNHDGELNAAKRLVDAAKAAGAQAVKFQTFSARDLVTVTAPKADYQIENTGAAESQLRMLERLELVAAEFSELAEYCRQQDILFLSTPYGAADIQMLGQWNVSALKIASALAVEPRFLAEAASLGVPLIVSTGMMTQDEVALAVETLQRFAPGRFVLLQCVTNYPATAGSSNIRAMQALGEAFQCPMGFSDHTETMTSSVLAVGLGACVLERHLTLDRDAEGPDHRASLNPKEFAEYVRIVREAESALGDGRKTPAPEEMRNLAKMRRSLVTARAMDVGHRLTAEDLAFKRPGTGIAPADWESVIGLRLLQAVEKDAVLQWSLLERDAN